MRSTSPMIRTWTWRRCARARPNSRPVCVARLPRSRFFIMEGGYASVARDPQRSVYGVLLGPRARGLRLLDRYEDIASGLYRKIQQTGAARRRRWRARPRLHRQFGRARNAASGLHGKRDRGCARVVAARRLHSRIVGHCATRRRRACCVARADGSAQSASAPAPQRTALLRKCRPRFATPFDRS